MYTRIFSLCVCVFVCQTVCLRAHEQLCNLGFPNGKICQEKVEGGGRFLICVRRTETESERESKMFVRVRMGGGSNRERGNGDRRG